MNRKMQSFLQPDADELRALDNDLLKRIGARSVPVPLVTTFEGFRPTWAVEALDRLLISGRVTELDGGALALTPAGRAAFASLGGCACDMRAEVERAARQNRPALPNTVGPRPGPRADKSALAGACRGPQ